MTTTTEITTLDLDLTGLADDPADFDLSAANVVYRDRIEALAQEIVPSVSLHGTADRVMVIAAYADREAAGQIDWRGLAERVDGNAILIACVQWTVTATADVVEGVITLDHPALDDEGFGTRYQAADPRIVAILTDPETGGMVTRIDVGPWGEDEEDMDRADKGLAEYGLRRVGPWGEDSGDQHRTALVTR